MLFKLSHKSESLALKLNPETPLILELCNEPVIQFEIKKAEIDEPVENLRNEVEKPSNKSIVVEAITSLPLIDKHEKILAEIADCIVYPNENNGILGYRDKAGEIIDFPDFKSLPLDLQKCLQEVYGTLAEKIEIFIRTLCWRFDILEVHHVFNLDVMRFSVDGTHWHLVPYDGPNVEKVEVFLEEFLDKEKRDQVISLVESGGEPLYHELFREAWGQRKSNPRSAIIMSIAAAESGLKQCITHLVPQNSWLLRELQSPPIDKIMHHYFPTLPVKEKLDDRVFIPQIIMKELKEGVDVRNKLVHTGFIPAKYKKYNNDLEQKTEELLLSVRDLLWLLDYYAGHQWALEQVREDTLISAGIKGLGKKESPVITTPGVWNTTLQVTFASHSDIRKM